MTQDDRMETITDPAEIRATSDERGCCDCRTFDQHERECILPDDHPKRPKQCGGCGTKWVDAETARACERRHGDDITTPAPVGAAVALDLDAIEARVNAATPGPWWVEQVGDFGDKSAVIECVRWRGYLNTLHLGEDTPTAEFIAHAREDVPALVAEVRRLTVEAATQREWFEAADAAAERRLDQSIAWMERAESAEAEVGTLRANWSLGYGDGVTEPQIGHVEFVAECERQFSEASEWRESQRWRDECHDAGHPDDEDCYEHDPALVLLTLRAKVSAVQALAEKRDVLYPPKWAFGAEENYCNGYRQARADFIAALATTGEGK